MLKDKIFTVVGIDVSQKAIDAFQVNTGFKAIQSKIEDLPFPDSYFDLIILDDVLEHLEDTDSCMEEIHRLLNENGVLLLSTPNLAAWFNRLLLFMGIQPLYTEVSFQGIFGRPGSDVVGHLRIFTSKALRGFLSHHGFKVISHKMSTFQSIPKIFKPIDLFFTISRSLGANHVIVCKKEV